MLADERVQTSMMQFGMDIDAEQQLQIPLNIHLSTDGTISGFNLSSCMHRENLTYTEATSRKPQAATCIAKQLLQTFKNKIHVYHSIRDSHTVIL